MALVFQYGETDARDIAVMAGTLMAFAPGLIAFSGQYVLSRTFYALSDTRTPFLLNLVIIGLNAGLSVTAYVLLPARWAVTGIAGAYSLALFTGWAVTAFVLNRRLTARDARASGLWRSTTAAAQARLLLAAVPATLVGHVTARWAAPGGAAAATGVGAASICAVFLLVAHPLRLTEITALVRGAATRLRRRP